MARNNKKAGFHGKPYCFNLSSLFVVTSFVTVILFGMTLLWTFFLFQSENLQMFSAPVSPNVAQNNFHTKASTKSALTKSGNNDPVKSDTSIENHSIAPTTNHSKRMRNTNESDRITANRLSENNNSRYGTLSDNEQMSPCCSYFIYEETPALDALRWLKRHQNRDGSWSGSAFAEECDPIYGKCCDGIGSMPTIESGLTGLAVLVFLGAGFTQDDGSEFAHIILKGLRYLKLIQDQDGYFRVRDGVACSMYGQALATLAFTEAYRLTSSRILKEYSQRGVNAILEAQNDHPELPGEKFGWRYFPHDGNNDTSVTGWMCLALHSAKASGLNVPEQSIRGIRHWIDYVTNNSHSRAGYQSPVETMVYPETMTAIAVMCRILTGDDIDSSENRAGISILLQDLPSRRQIKSRIDYYYWFFGSMAVNQLDNDIKTIWNKALNDVLLDHQFKREHGCQTGSWDPFNSEWGKYGGRVYATAMNCLSVELSQGYTKVIGRNVKNNKIISK